MNTDKFFFDLSIQFPEFAVDLDAKEGAHYNMEQFASYTVKKIEKKNIPELHKCFNFIEFCIEFVSPELENALNVSYCEALIYYDDYKRGIEMKKVMPQKLLHFYSEYKKYYISLK